MSHRHNQGSTLYLRNLPASLVREAKATAARRGITLTALVEEGLAALIEQAPPFHDQVPEQLTSEQDWYETHKAELLAQYPGEYLAIVKQEVLDHDHAFDALARRVFERLGRQPVFMPRCVSGERVIALRSPRRQQP
jgi:hypothetical protein